MDLVQSRSRVESWEVGVDRADDKTSEEKQEEGELGNSLSQAVDLPIISNYYQHKHTVAAERFGVEIRLQTYNVTLNNVFNLHEFSRRSCKMTLTLSTQ